MVYYTFYRRLFRFLIFTQSLYNVVSTTFFTKRRVGVTLVLLYTFHHFLFPSTLQDFRSPTMRVRERRSWTKEEDNMLRAAIQLGESIYQVTSAMPRHSMNGSNRGAPYGSPFKMAFDC